MAPDAELTVDGGLDREGLLGRSWKSEFSSWPLALAVWLVRDLRPAVRASTTYMLIGGAEIAKPRSSFFVDC